MGISNAGQKVEDLGLQITGYDESKVEYKSVDGDNTGATTINQVRAIHLIPLAIFHNPTKQWYVVPAIDVIKLVKGRSGQHGLSSFENCTLNLSKLDKYKCKTEFLKKTIENGFIDGNLKSTLISIFSQYKINIKQVINNLNQQLNTIII